MFCCLFSCSYVQWPVESRPAGRSLGVTCALLGPTMQLKKDRGKPVSTLWTRAQDMVIAVEEGRDSLARLRDLVVVSSLLTFNDIDNNYY